MEKEFPYLAGWFSSPSKEPEPDEPEGSCPVLREQGRSDQPALHHKIKTKYIDLFIKTYKYAFKSKTVSTKIDPFSVS